MPANVEIKARVTDLGAIRSRAVALATAAPEELEQEDIFFALPPGAGSAGDRLKLRSLSADRGELILYQRANVPGPKRSNYQLAPTSDPAALAAILSAVLPRRATVRKRRTVYHVGQTRVHLDQVVGLGDFVELEVVLRDGQTTDEGAAIARELMHRLGIDAAELIDRAYVDLLAPET
ncbi:MAG TPA: class IV adenylate cyclase [Pirellulales bacterium]|nr:class IV adenylate cyclase [Pirellulales bacterium]